MRYIITIGNDEEKLEVEAPSNLAALRQVTPLPWPRDARMTKLGDMVMLTFGGQAWEVREAQ